MTSMNDLVAQINAISPTQYTNRSFSTKAAAEKKLATLQSQFELKNGAPITDQDALRDIPDFLKATDEKKAAAKKDIDRETKASADWVMPTQTPARKATPAVSNSKT